MVKQSLAAALSAVLAASAPGFAACEVVAQKIVETPPVGLQAPGLSPSLAPLGADASLSPSIDLGGVPGLESPAPDPASSPALLQRPGAAVETPATVQREALRSPAPERRASEAARREEAAREGREEARPATARAELVVTKSVAPVANFISGSIETQQGALKPYDGSAQAPAEPEAVAPSGSPSRRGLSLLPSGALAASAVLAAPAVAAASDHAASTVASGPSYALAALGAGLLGLAAWGLAKINPLRRARAALSRHDDARVARDQAAGKAPGLPLSYKLFFAAVSLIQFGSWMGAIIIPMAAFSVSPQFLIIVQGTLYASMIPGSVIGADWAKRFDSRITFAAMAAITGLALITITSAGSMGLAPMAFMAVFLLARGLTGLGGGATMGVADNDIIARTVSKDLMDRAQGLYNTVRKLMGVVAPAMVGALLPVTGMMPLVIIAAAAVFLGLLPLALIQFKDKMDAPAAASAAAPAPLEPLSKAGRNAYIFVNFVDMAFFGLIGPFLGMTVFDKSMAGYLVGAFSAGGFLVAVLFSLPGNRVQNFLSEKGWLAANVLSWPLFLGASLIFASQALSLAAVVLLGAANMGAFIKWRSHVLSRLTASERPKTLRKLSIATMLLLIGVFAVLSAGRVLSLPVSMFQLFSGVSIVTSLIGLGVYWSARHPSSKV